MVMVAGLKGYDKMKRENDSGIRKMYCKHEEGSASKSELTFFAIGANRSEARS